jgi:hypothetical protein
MLKRVAIVFGLYVLLCSVFMKITVAGPIADDGRIVVQLANNISAEILPQMELLAGVLSQTSWMQTSGPNGKGNRYFKALQKFFSEYREHPAVKMAEKMNARDFTYDAPPNFILQLTPLPELESRYGYSDYLIKRAGGKENLETFRIALRDLSRQSDFLSFFKQHRAVLEQCLQETLKDFDAEKITKWLDQFFGWSGSEFHLVFAPAMFPGGGYGAWSKTDDGRTIIYQVIREEGDRIFFDPHFATGIELEYLTFHELGHSFVNPSVEKYNELIKKLKLEEFYKPVEEIMKRNAYGTLDIFLCETINRAVTMIAMRDLHADQEIHKKILAGEIKRGFYLNPFTIRQLDYYRDHRDQYKRFDDFLPYLFEQYVENRGALLKLAE